MLKVVYLLDTSASMSGTALIAMQEGVSVIGQAIERAVAAQAELSMTMIAYSSQPVLLHDNLRHPLQSLQLEAGGTSNLGRAWTLVIEQILPNVSPHNRLWIILFTDGVGTDDWEKPGKLLIEQLGDFGLQFAVGCGEHAELAPLGSFLSENISLSTHDIDSLTILFRRHLESEREA